jgi:hypothetical protein
VAYLQVQSQHLKIDLLRKNHEKHQSGQLIAELRFEASPFYKDQTGGNKASNINPSR